MTDQELEKERKKLNIARKIILNNFPFEAHLMLQTKFIEIEDEKACPTFQTDGEDIQWNPAFCQTLDLEQVKGTIIHELEHIKLIHPFRMGSRDCETWNKACDYAINGNLIKSGFKLPKGVLHEPMFTGKSPEDIYRIIFNKNNKTPNNSNQNNPGNTGQNGGQQGSNPSQNPANGQGNGSGNNPSNGQNFGGIIKPKPGSENVQEKIERAVFASRMAGKGKSLDEIEIRKTFESQTDYRDIIHSLCTELTTGDYSWEFPNRNYLENDFILPSLKSRSIGKVAIACDVSGSVARWEVEKMVSETLSILKLYADEGSEPELTCIYFSDGITKIEVLGIDDVPKPAGCGGTSYKEVMSYVKENNIEGLICMTDGDCYEYGENPQVPLYWAIIRKDCVESFKNRAPFGKHSGAIYRSNSKNMKHSTSRRQFLKSLTIGMIALPILKGSNKTSQTIEPKISILRDTSGSVRFELLTKFNEVIQNLSNNYDCDIFNMNHVGIQPVKFPDQMGYYGGGGFLYCDGRIENVNSRIVILTDCPAFSYDAYLKFELHNKIYGPSLIVNMDMDMEKDRNILKSDWMSIKGCHNLFHDYNESIRDIVDNIKEYLKVNI